MHQQTGLSHQAATPIAPIEPTAIAQSELQPTATHQATAPIVPIDPNAIAQSDSSTAIILASGMLIYLSLSAIVQLMAVMLQFKTR